MLCGRVGGGGGGRVEKMLRHHLPYQPKYAAIPHKGEIAAAEMIAPTLEYSDSVCFLEYERVSWVYECKIKFYDILLQLKFFNIFCHFFLIWHQSL